jgi:hypothetical protein
MFKAVSSITAQVVRTIRAGPTVHVYARRHYARAKQYQIRLNIRGGSAQRAFHTMDLIELINASELLPIELSFNKHAYEPAKAVSGLTTVRIPVPLTKERSDELMAILRLLILTMA